MSNQTCATCGKPLVRRHNERLRKFLARRTCSLSCGSRLGQQTKIQRGATNRGGGYPAWHAVTWPRVTGEADWNNAFARHNVIAKDGGMFRVLRPATHVNSRSAAADTADRGGV